MKILFSVLAMGICFSATAATEASTELFRPVNVKGDPIQITFAQTHPYQDELVALIKNAELPSILKYELLGDLQATAIMESNEIVTYADIERQLKLVLSKVIKTRTKLADGSVTEKTSEEYTPAKADSVLGIHIAPINMAVDGLSSTFVAAYTERDPKRVVYFTELLKKMSPDESLTLVLHEQAHRLSYLADVRDDERFIEGWSAMLLRYLQGKMLKSEFFEILKRNGLRWRDEAGLGGDYDSVLKLYRASIKTVVPAEAVQYHGLLKSEGKSTYVLQVDTKAAFAAQPDMQRADFAQIKLGVIESNGEYSIISDEVERALAQGYFALTLLVTYDQLPVPDSTGRLHTEVAIKDIKIDITEKVKRLQNRIKSVVEHHDEVFAFGNLNELNPVCEVKFCEVPSTGIYLGDRRADEMLAFVSRVDRALTLIKTKTPALYARLYRPRRKWLSLDFRAQTFELEMSPEGFSLNGGLGESLGRLFFHVPMMGFEDLSVRKIADRITQTLTESDLSEWEALAAANKALGSKTGVFAPIHGQNPKDLRLINDFWARSPKPLSAFRCVAERMAFYPSTLTSITVQLVDDETIRWNYDRYDVYVRSRDDRLELKLKISRELLLSNPEAVREFILNGVINSGSSKYEAYELDVDGVAVWDEKKNKFIIVSKEVWGTGSEHFDSRSFEAYLDECREKTKKGSN